MKKYIEPKLRTINLETEDGILLASGMDAYNHEAQGTGDEIDEQFTNKKNPNMWDRDGIWK